MQGVLVRRWFWVAASFLVMTSTADAQAKRAAKAPPVKRAQNSEAIESAGGNFAIAMGVKWDGGEQEVIALNGCTATIKTARQLLGVLTVDEQTFDAGDLTGVVTPEDAPDAFEIKWSSEPNLRPFVTRKRTLYIDGAPRVAPPERVVYLSIRVPKSESANVTEAVVLATRSYRDSCRRL